MYSHLKSKKHRFFYQDFHLASKKAVMASLTVPVSREDDQELQIPEDDEPIDLKCHKKVNLKQASNYGFIVWITDNSVTVNIISIIIKRRTNPNSHFLHRFRANHADQEDKLVERIVP